MARRVVTPTDKLLVELLEQGDEIINELKKLNGGNKATVVSEPKAQPAARKQPAKKSGAKAADSKDK